MLPPIGLVQSQRLHYLKSFCNKFFRKDEECIELKLNKTYKVIVHTIGKHQLLLSSDDKLMFSRGQAQTQ